MDLRSGTISRSRPTFKVLVLLLSGDVSFNHGPSGAISRSRPTFKVALVLLLSGDVSLNHGPAVRHNLSF